MPKRLIEPRVLQQYPAPGSRVAIQLQSIDLRDQFWLDLHRGKINLAKGTHQHRARRVVILARLDFAGPPHRNPDGTEIGGTHLHLYREGYADKWAFEPPADDFTNLADPWIRLEDFLRFCSIVDHVTGQRNLFP